MAYPYRGGQAPREAKQNETPEGARSPNQNQNGNRSSGNFGGNDGRGGMTRRFTLNALPTLSPIGQQRRQAAGDMVSTVVFFSAHTHKHGRAGRRSIAWWQILADNGQTGGISVGGFGTFEDLRVGGFTSATGSTSIRNP